MCLFFFNAGNRSPTGTFETVVWNDEITLRSGEATHVPFHTVNHHLLSLSCECLMSRPKAI